MPQKNLTAIIGRHQHENYGSIDDCRTIRLMIREKKTALKEETAVYVRNSYNVRDLGGIPVTGGTLQFGRIIRGEAPYLLGAEGIQDLIQHGVQSIIDLRGPMEHHRDTPSHVRKQAKDAGMDLHVVDLNPPSGWYNRADGRDATEMLGELYFEGLNHGGPDLIAALDTAIPKGGVYIHCAAGKDRTGTAVGFLLWALGTPKDLILEDYMLSRENYVPLTLKLQASGNYQELKQVEWDAHAPKRWKLEAALALVEQHSSKSDWLESLGLSRQKQATWHALLTEPRQAHSQAH